MRFDPACVLVRLFVATVAVCFCAGSGSAHLTDEIVVEGCTDIDLHPDPVAVIEPCTKLIEDGTLKGNQLAAALRHRGDAYFRTKQYRKAYAAYDKALEIQPLYPRALWNRANLNSVHGRIEAKVRDLERALSIDPSHPLTLEAVGSVFSYVGEPKRAIDYYSQALRADPSMLRVMFNRALSYMVVNENSLALADLEHILKFSRDEINRNFIVPRGNSLDLYGKVLAQRGNVLRKMQRYDLAQQDLDRLVSLYPKNPAVYEHRANLWIVTKRPDKAAAEFTRMIELDPRDTDSYQWRARMYYTMKQFDKALQDVAVAITINPAEGESYWIRAGVYNKMRQRDLALESYEYAFALDASLLPNHLNHLKHRGYYSGPQLTFVDDQIRNGTIACIVDPHC